MQCESDLRRKCALQIHDVQRRIASLVANNVRSSSQAESKEAAEKRKREYRNNLIKYAKAKVDCEMDKFDLYVDPATVPVENERFWEIEPHLGDLGEEKKVG